VLRSAFPSRRRVRAILRVALLSSDVVALFLATVAASLIRFHRVFHINASPVLPISFNMIDLSFVMVGVWLIALWMEGLYDLSRVFWGTGEYSRVIRALSVGVIGVIIIEYALRAVAVSRAWTLLGWAFGCVFVIAGRALVRAGMAAQRRRGRLLRPTLIVGYNAEAVDILSAFRRNPGSGLMPVAFLANSNSEKLHFSQAQEAGIPCWGSAREIRSVLDEHYADTVLLVSSAFDHDVLARIIAELRDRDIDIQLSSGLFDVTTSRILIREQAGIPLITIRSVSFAPWKRAVKRTFDLVVGALIVLVGTPLWLAFALAIKIDSRGPVFYRQERVGRAGAPFGMFKFRSMYQDADERLAGLQASGANEATGPLFKMEDDPRVTRMGKWLRKYSIDEFPQLINVLLGNMSLVGPRPPLPSETALYTDSHWRRMEVIPGMTGLWQVSGRSRLTFEEMVRLDLFYIENWSVSFDIGLLLRTIPAVLFARGAY